MFSSEPQGLAAKRQKEPSSSSSISSLARTDTIKAGHFDGAAGDSGGAAAGKGEKGGAAPPPADGKVPLESSGDLPPPSPSPPPPPPPPEAAAARLAALSAELDRLQKNQAVLANALARGRAVLVAPSSARRDGGGDDDDDEGGGGGNHRRSTLRGALADPPLVDPSPGAQAAHRKKLQRREAKARGGASSSQFVSGGLCGFEVAADLLRYDFAAAAAADETSSSASANKEFRAAAFDEPQTRQELRSLRSQAAELLPAGDPKLASFLKQLEAQQRIILKMLAAGSGGGGGGNGNGGAGAGGGGESPALIPASLMLNPLLKNPLARLAAAGMTVPDDEGTAVTE